MGVEQTICTKVVRNKSNKRTSLTQSKKKSPAVMRKKIEMQIMDRGDVSIEKDRKLKIEMVLLLLITIFLPQRIFQLIFCIVLIKMNTIIIIRRNGGKKEPQNEDDFSPKEKNGQSKGKMNKELHSLESYIKQGKSPSEIYKSNLLNLSRSTIFERCKRYKEDSSFERKSDSKRKTKYIDEHIQYILNLINTDPSMTSTKIREKLFEKFEEIY